MADTYQKNPLYRRWWFWLLAGIVMFLLGYLIGMLILYGDRANPLDALAGAFPVYALGTQYCPRGSLLHYEP